MWLSYKEIGERVTAIRLSLPGTPSAQEFAELLGRKGSVSTIRNVEKGCEPSWKKGPNEKLLRQIADLGSVHIDHFRAGNVHNLDRQEKLSVLRWLNKMTAALKEEVGPTSALIGGLVEDAEAESVHTNVNRGKTKDGDSS